MKYLYKITIKQQTANTEWTTEHYFSKKTECYLYLRRFKPEQLKGGIIEEFRERNGKYFNHNNEIVVYETTNKIKHWNLPIPT